MLPPKFDDTETMKDEQPKVAARQSATIRVIIVGGSVVFLLVTIGMMAVSLPSDDGYDNDYYDAEGDGEGQTKSPTKLTTFSGVKQSEPALLMNASLIQKIVTLVRSHLKATIGVVVIVLLVVVAAAMVLESNSTDQEMNLLPPALPADRRPENNSSTTDGSFKEIEIEEKPWWQEHLGLIIASSIAVFAIGIIFAALFLTRRIRPPCKGGRHFKVSNVFDIPGTTPGLQGHLANSLDDWKVINDSAFKDGKQLAEAIQSNMNVILRQANQKLVNMLKGDTVLVNLPQTGVKSSCIVASANTLVDVYVYLAKSPSKEAPDVFFILNHEKKLVLEGPHAREPYYMVAVEAQLKGVDGELKNLEELQQMYAYVCNLASKIAILNNPL